MITTLVNILYFLLAKFCQKLKLLNLKIEGFQSPEGRKQKINKKKSLFFSYVAINIEAQLKICTLYLVYNQIWLNLR
jgi:hypothetical protein